MQFNPVALIADVESTGSRRKMSRELGLKYMSPDKRRKLGIWTVQSYLKERSPGETGLTIDPICTNTTREFESLEWVKDSLGNPTEDGETKGSDHALDPARYVVHTVKGKN